MPRGAPLNYARNYAYLHRVSASSYAVTFAVERRTERERGEKTGEKKEEAKIGTGTGGNVEIASSFSLSLSILYPRFLFCEVLMTK